MEIDARRDVMGHLAPAELAQGVAARDILCVLGVKIYIEKNCAEISIF